MKRTATLLLAVTLLAGGWQAASSEPRGRVDEAANASWIVRTERPGHYLWYAVLVEIREVAGGDRRAFAVPIRGSCRRQRGGLSCSGGGRIAQIGSGAFEMSPDLSSARVSFRQRGRSYLAELEGRGQGPGLYVSGEYCFSWDGEEGEGYGGGLLRDATSIGSFAGRKMKPAPKQLEFSYMARGAMVTECDFWGPILVSRSGNEVRYRWDLPAAAVTAR